MTNFDNGMVAPDFSLTLTNGTKTKLSELTKGKENTILFFYPSSSSYSKTCQEQAKAYNNFIGGLGNDVAVVGVSAAGVREAKKFKDKFASSFPIGVIKPKVLDQYGVRNKGVIPKVLGVFNRIFISKRVTFILDNHNRVINRLELPLAANGPEMTAHAKDINARIKAIRAVDQTGDASHGKAKETTKWQERSVNHTKNSDGRSTRT